MPVQELPITGLAAYAYRLGKSAMRFAFTMTASS